MQRFLVIMVFASLLWQQGACCCGELLLGWSAPQHTTCCDHEPPADEPGPHQHHICVGSHLFFLADHEVPTLDDPGVSVPLALPELAPDVAQFLGLAAHFRYLSQRPATPALPVRAALQVFVI